MSFEYVTDLAYVRHFEADLAPMRLRQVAALNGVAPPPAEDFDYCELGCGRGDTLVALAAANARARFVGVDIMASHVQGARDFARAAAVDNVEFIEQDFEALLGSDAARGPFDYVVAHGVLSWVGPQKRQAVIEFAKQRLKPGGVCFVSYNAMPGWAALEPLRQLLASARAERSEDRAKAGLELAQRLAAAGAQYFAQTKAAREMLDKLSRLDLAYVAHEYLHAHWDPMYFAQVAGPMAAADLHFAGVQPLFLNYRDLAVPADAVALFAELDDRVAFESLKDYALNEYFRRDVYVRGPVVRDPAVTQAYLDQTSFVAAAEGTPDDADVRLLHHTMHFETPLFRALFAALAEGPQSGRGLGRRLDLAEFGGEAIRAGLLRMLVGAHVAPCKRVGRAGEVDPDLRYRLPLAFNRAVVTQQGKDLAPLVVVSPLAGTGISVTSMQALVLRLLTEIEPPERDAWIERTMGQPGLRVQLAGRSVDSQVERVAMVQRERDEFCRERLGKFVELQILEPAG